MLIALGIVLMGFVITAPSARAATVTWDTDTDFSAGSLVNTEVVGVGTPAIVSLIRDATDWKNELPASNPGAREGPAIVYDSTHDRVILFGGYNGANLADTWIYNPSLNTWTNANPPNQPSGRAYAGLSFDASNGTTVLFGGVSDVQSEADTWEYDFAGNQWYQTTPGTSPPPLTSYSMAYYSSVQRSVLVGQSLVTLNMVTWAYDVAADSWTNRGATFNPARSSPGVAYHVGLNRLVLFGGSFLTTTYGDTWEYNYNTNAWTLTVADGSGPTARAAMGLSYRSTDSSVWMFGGTPGPMGDTWRYFDANNTRVWVLVPTQRSPPARHTFGMTDITQNLKSVIYGGILAGGGRASDTWTLGPAYRTSGTWTSANADGTQSNVDWQTLSWSPTSQPAGTTLRFHVATSNDPAGPWTFVGPTCAVNTYYTTSGTAICSTQDNARYAQVRAYELTSDNLFTPTMDTVTLTYNAAPAAPSVLETSPVDGALGVSQSAPIVIRFTEQMDVPTVTYMVSPTTTVSPQWTEGNSTLTLTASPSLQECKAYTVQITAGKDMQGNDLAAGPVPNPWSFTTACVYPTITATNPSQGTMDVPLTANIVVTFSEAMDTATVTWVIAPNYTLSPTWSGGNTVLTLSHAGDFTQCMMHTVTIAGKDTAGLSLVPGSVPNPFDFHTHCREPYIVSTSPFHLETGVATTANIVVEFSEPMLPATVTWTLAPTLTLTPAWTNQNQTLTLSHAVPFTVCQTYTANITSGKDADEGLDLFPGQHEAHAPHPWKFTIACPNPFIVLTLPMDGDTGVNQFLNITVQFSEPMVPATVTWSITPNIALVPTWTAGNQILTLEHAFPFACGTNTVQILTGTDVDGNPLIAGPAPNPWTFSPSCPNPFIAATNPTDGQTGIPLLADIVITFSEAMNTTTVVWGLAPTVTGMTEAWSGSNTVLTLSHTTPFSQSTNYTIAVFAGKDVDGNDLVSGPEPNPWRFRSVGVNPQILATNPADLATNVPTATNVVVDFSEPMDTASVLAVPTPPILLNYAWSNGNQTLTLSHFTNFAECTTYSFNVTGNDVDSDPLIAGPVPNPWTFATVCFSPVIADTNPPDAAVDVAVDAPVFLNFSKAMNTATVQAVFNPVVAVNYLWSNGNRSLELTHGTFFAGCTVYGVTVTGQDTFGNNLAAGPVPNPWSFRTFCPPPHIQSTVPVHQATNVGTAAPIVVTFDRGMDTATVTWNFSPGAGVTSGWTSGDTVLTLTPNPALQQCTQYTVTIAGKSKESKDLAPGPVPNPWTFSTVCTIGAPTNLQIARLADIVLTWNTVPTATSYNVYSSQNRFAAWPWSIIGTPTTNTFTATGHLNDGLTHYYIVRAVRTTTESTNSTMAVKLHMAVGFNPTGSNVRWFSLPYRSSYARASDIANELGPSRIDVVAKWNPATQAPILYYYFRGAWHGTDFSIAAGDGLYIGARSAFAWAIVGTDRSVTLSFTFNGPTSGNVNWISLPYTGTYQTASDIVRQIEGNTGGGANTKIVEVVKWDPTTQSLIRYFWTAGGWTGVDFAIGPGDGIYLRISSSFTWQPTLVTPEVP